MVVNRKERNVRFILRNNMLFIIAYIKKRFADKVLLRQNSLSFLVWPLPKQQQDEHNAPICDNNMTWKIRDFGWKYTYKANHVLKSIILVRGRDLHVRTDIIR